MGWLSRVRERLREWKADRRARHHAEGRALIAEREENRRLRNRRYDLERMPYAEYLKSPEWTAIRTEVLQRDGHACSQCGSSISLQVHHTTYLYRRGEEPLSALETLCRVCHRSRHDLDDES